MSKPMILLIEEPETCFDCPCIASFEGVNICQAFDEYISQRDLGMPRPSWCPLKPLPSECTDLAEEEYFALSNMFARGWNACLEELEK